jgi:hypothetical protein
MMSPAADTALIFFFTSGLRNTRSSHKRHTKLHPYTGDEFTLINQEDASRGQHLNVARNKRRSVSAGYKRETPKLFRGHSCSEVLQKRKDY